MFDPKLKEALGRVQKPGRYTGGEPGSVYKDKEKVDVRFASVSYTHLTLPTILRV